MFLAWLFTCIDLSPSPRRQDVYFWLIRENKEVSKLEFTSTFPPPCRRVIRVQVGAYFGLVCSAMVCSAVRWDM